MKYGKVHTLSDVFQRTLSNYNKIASGTITERAGAPKQSSLLLDTPDADEGMIRFNNSINKYELYTQGRWSSLFTDDDLDTGGVPIEPGENVTLKYLTYLLQQINKNVIGSISFNFDSYPSGTLPAVEVSALTLVNGGTDYKVNDRLILKHSSAIEDTIINVRTVNSSGVITAATIVNGGNYPSGTNITTAITAVNGTRTDGADIVGKNATFRVTLSVKKPSYLVANGRTLSGSINPNGGTDRTYRTSDYLNSYAVKSGYSENHVIASIKYGVHANGSVVGTDNKYGANTSHYHTFFDCIIDPFKLSFVDVDEDDRYNYRYEMFCGFQTTGTYGSGAYVNHGSSVIVVPLWRNGPTLDRGSWDDPNYGKFLLRMTVGDCGGALPISVGWYANLYRFQNFKLKSYTQKPGGGNLPSVPSTVILNITKNVFAYSLYNTIMSMYNWDGDSPVNVEININNGVIVGSSTDIDSSLSIRNMPMGSLIKIKNRGTIIGKGGLGGVGANIPPSSNGKPREILPPTSGENGGNALLCANTVLIDNDGGKIIAGAGGGGGGMAYIIKNIFLNGNSLYEVRTSQSLSDYYAANDDLPSNSYLLSHIEKNKIYVQTFFSSYDDKCGLIIIAHADSGDCSFEFTNLGSATITNKGFDDVSLGAGKMNMNKAFADDKQYAIVLVGNITHSNLANLQMKITKNNGCFDKWKFIRNSDTYTVETISPYYINASTTTLQCTGTDMYFGGGGGGGGAGYDVGIEGRGGETGTIPRSDAPGQFVPPALPSLDGSQGNPSRITPPNFNAGAGGTPIWGLDKTAGGSGGNIGEDGKYGGVSSLSTVGAQGGQAGFAIVGVNNITWADSTRNWVTDSSKSGTIIGKTTTV